MAANERRTKANHGDLLEAARSPRARFVGMAVVWFFAGCGIVQVIWGGADPRRDLNLERARAIACDPSYPETRRRAALVIVHERAQQALDTMDALADHEGLLGVDARRYLQVAREHK